MKDEFFSVLLLKIGKFSFNNLEYVLLFGLLYISKEEPEE